MACFELLPRARVGWHTARTSVPPPPPCSSGAPVRWLMARGRRASGVAAAPRSHAAGAPVARRRRAVGGACACRTRSNGRRRPLVVGGWCALQLRITSGWLPLIGGSIEAFVSSHQALPMGRRCPGCSLGWLLPRVARGFGCAFRCLSLPQLPPHAPPQVPPRLLPSRPAQWSVPSTLASACAPRPRPFSPLPPPPPSPLPPPPLRLRMLAPRPPLTSQAPLPPLPTR